jgi:hypothetical protein
MSKFKKGDIAKNISDQDRSLTMGKEYPVLDVDLSGNIEFLDDDGDYRTRRPDDYALGAAEPALPIRTRTVTVTEIIPGEYDGILISEPGDYAVFIRMHIDDHGKFMDAPSLRAAARVFQAVAEALEENEDNK